MTHPRMAAWNMLTGIEDGRGNKVSVGSVSVWGAQATCRAGRAG